MVQYLQTSRYICNRYYISLPACTDENDRCDYIFKQCKLPSQKIKMYKECRRTCSFCGK